MLVFANVTTHWRWGSCCCAGALSTLDLLVVMAVGAFNGINNIAAVAEGSRLLPGQASAVSALLMGCLVSAALARRSRAVLADPARGGEPRPEPWAGSYDQLMPLRARRALRVRPRKRRSGRPAPFSGASSDTRASSRSASTRPARPFIAQSLPRRGPLADHVASSEPRETQGVA